MYVSTFLPVGIMCPQSLKGAPSILSPIGGYSNRGVGTIWGQFGDIIGDI